MSENTTPKPQREKTTYRNLVQMAQQPRPRTRRMAAALVKIETLTQHEISAPDYMLRFALSAVGRTVREATNPATETAKHVYADLEKANRALRQQDEIIFELRAALEAEKRRNDPVQTMNHLKAAGERSKQNRREIARMTREARASK